MSQVITVELESKGRKYWHGKEPGKSRDIEIVIGPALESCAAGDVVTLEAASIPVKGKRRYEALRRIDAVKERPGEHRKSAGGPALNRERAKALFRDDSAAEVPLKLLGGRAGQTARSQSRQEHKLSAAARIVGTSAAMVCNGAELAFSVAFPVVYGAVTAAAWTLAFLINPRVALRSAAEHWRGIAA